MRRTNLTSIGIFRLQIQSQKVSALGSTVEPTVYVRLLSKFVSTTSRTVWFVITSASYEKIGHLHWCIVKTRSRLHIPCSISSDDESCLEFLAMSLKRCLHEHKTCFSSRSPDEIQWVPTRLIDVLHGSNSYNTIQLVEKVETVVSSDKGIQYLTLSRMWGKKRSFELTENNYQDMRNGIEMSSLPQCFQDAVFVSRRLGIRYLWIGMHAFL